MAGKKSVAKTNNDNNPIKVLKEATCLTTSGKSTLGYQVGIDDSAAIHLKVSSNDGGGFFSDEWLAFTGIQEALAAWPEDQGITSRSLWRLFSGRSANTPGFLIAVLCAEGLLEPMPKRKRVHQVCDPAPFLASLEKPRGGSSKKPRPKARAKAAPKAKAKAKAKSAPRSTAKTAKTPRKSPASSRKGK